MSAQLRIAASCRVVPHFEPKGYIRPWRACLAIDIVDGTLLPGDSITINYGDRSGGSAGTRAQTFVEKAFRFRTLIDAQGSGQYVTLPSSPATEIVAGEAVRLVAIVPSEAETGRQFDLVVKAEDGWGNPATSYSGTIALEEENGAIANLPDRYTFQPDVIAVSAVFSTARSADPASSQYAPELWTGRSPGRAIP